LFPANTGEALVQSAAVVIDPSSGGIRGLIGYRGKYFYHGFNRATQLKRQPGSSIKPLAVYAPALEKGYTPNSILMDEKTDFDGYSPSNYNDSYQGKVSLYDALIHSINVPAVALLNEIGVEAGIDFLKKTGIPLHADDRNLSIALGGFTEGVSPLDMAQAFSTFPNLGSMYQAHAITKITTGTGEVLLEVVQEAVEVMKPENAYTMTTMLMGVVEEGTGKNAALGRPTAGKTGTTELPLTEDFKGISGARDAWFVGYTPELVTAVWVGYDKLDPNYVMSSSGGNHPALIFQSIMSKALLNTPISSFLIPENYREPGAKGNKEKENGKGPWKKKKKN
jgi:penicillin-binding protein 2A